MTKKPELRKRGTSRVKINGRLEVWYNDQAVALQVRTPDVNFNYPVEQSFCKAGVILTPDEAISMIAAITHGLDRVRKTENAKIATDGI